MVLNVHYLTETLNASALQQFCYCLFKVNKQKNTFKKQGCFAHVMAEAWAAATYTVPAQRHYPTSVSCHEKSCTESIKG